MDCREVLDNLNRIAEDDLPAGQMLVLRAHLAECRDCGAAYRDVTELAAELRGLPRPQPPAELRGRIGVALDLADATARRLERRTPWETVGPYLAAAAVIAVAFAVTAALSGPRRGQQVARTPAREVLPTRPALPGETAPTVGAPAGTEAPVDPKAEEARAEAAVRAANERITALQAKEALKSRDGELMWPRDMGPGRSTGTSGADASVPGEPPRSVPGTFSAGDGPAAPTVIGPTGPTSIELGFRPPEDPVTGKAVSGVVEITARETLPRVTVTATGDAGLEIGKPGGVLYDGPARAGETVSVPLPMTASAPGLHEVEIKVQSDVPGGNTEIKAFVPNFRSEPAPAPRTNAADKPVRLVFRNAPVRQALMDIARQAGLRLEMAEGLGTEKVTQDVRGVPARAALRAVAEGGGYQVEEANGVFRVTRGSAADNAGD